MIKPVCPVCGKDTHVDKVSDIVRRHAHRSWAGSTPYGGTLPGTTNKLAAMLAPPQKPDPNSDLPYVVFCLLAALAGGALLYRVLKGRDAVGDRIPGKHTLPGALVFSSVVGVPTLLALWGPFHWWGIARGKGPTQRWRAAMHRWDNAYYCAWHDIVFIPGDQQTYQPDRLHTLIGWGREHEQMRSAGPTASTRHYP